MNIMRLVVASVSTKSVFKRFAKLSDKDKDAVVEKVKEKVNGKKTDDKEEAKLVEKETKEETKPAEKDVKEDVSEDKKSIDNLVGDLAEEIEVIKTDGQISPTEVLGLIDNVVQMVHALVQAKPGNVKKASREEMIAERVASVSLCGLDLSLEDEVNNSIRDHLSGTGRKTKENLMLRLMRRQFRGLDKRLFGRIWDELVDEGYLVPVAGGSYVWEM